MLYLLSDEKWTERPRTGTLIFFFVNLHMYRNLNKTENMPVSILCSNNI